MRDKLNWEVRHNLVSLLLEGKISVLPFGRKSKVIELKKKKICRGTKGVHQDRVGRTAKFACTLGTLGLSARQTFRKLQKKRSLVRRGENPDP